MLIIKNLSKSFGKKEIFKSFSYEFSDKGLYRIKGESGVGKTTLLRIISGIDTKYTGSVLGGGCNNVSVAFQEYRLFPNLTILENITEAAFKNANESDVLKARDLLLSLGFSEYEFSLRPSELSGGMKQRVSFARALLRQTPVLLLDEPTKELDERLCNIVKDLIKKEAEKRLVILITHSDSDVETLNHEEIDLSALKQLK